MHKSVKFHLPEKQDAEKQRQLSTLEKFYLPVMDFPNILKISLSAFIDSESS